MTTSEKSGFWRIAQDSGLPCELVGGGEVDLASQMCNLLARYDVQVLFLAGYLRLLPTDVIDYLGGMVMNTHPALLPRFGGKGMFGLKVHEAVLAAGERQTGATVHWVTDTYDDGDIIAQETIEIRDGTTPSELQDQVKAVERCICVRALDAVCSANFPAGEKNP